MAKNLQFVVFSIGKELYGVGIEAVQEIVRVPEITEVPDAPVFLEGVINLRGKIVPVIDLRKRFRLQGREKTKSTRVLIADNAGSLVGLLVDTVSEVLKIQPEAIEEPPQMISAVGVEYITGVAKMGAGLIIILDLKHVLSLEEISKIGNSPEAGVAARAA
ncbi:MAG: purine-binding chemotaxis protein CheW [Nitrospirae bacterium]|nr:MAG: purine-binding chemotaxis protein CheW [Nitrospirota bacterium]